MLEIFKQGGVKFIGEIKTASSLANPILLCDLLPKPINYRQGVLYINGQNKG